MAKGAGLLQYGEGLLTEGIPGAADRVSFREEAGEAALQAATRERGAPGYRVGAPRGVPIQARCFTPAALGTEYRHAKGRRAEGTARWRQGMSGVGRAGVAPSSRSSLRGRVGRGWPRSARPMGSLVRSPRLALRFASAIWRVTCRSSGSGRRARAVARGGEAGLGRSVVRARGSTFDCRRRRAARGHRGQRAKWPAGMRRAWPIRVKARRSPVRGAIPRDLGGLPRSLRDGARGNARRWKALRIVKAARVDAGAGEAILANRGPARGKLGRNRERQRASRAPRRALKKRRRGRVGYPADGPRRRGKREVSEAFRGAFTPLLPGLDASPSPEAPRKGPRARPMNPAPPQGPSPPRGCAAARESKFAGRESSGSVGARGAVTVAEIGWMYFFSCHPGKCAASVKTRCDVYRHGKG
jgi:hypothetical protein